MTPTARYPRRHAHHLLVTPTSPSDHPYAQYQKAVPKTLHLRNWSRVDAMANKAGRGPEDIPVQLPIDVAAMNLSYSRSSG